MRFPNCFSVTFVSSIFFGLVAVFTCDFAIGELVSIQHENLELIRFSSKSNCTKTQ